MIEISTLFGYSSMLLLGVVLGLIGAGGSILTVPVLVYLLSIPASQATGYSLVIVGTTALVGAIEYLRRNQSSPRMALIFGSPAIIGVYLTRRFFFPAVPDPVAEVGSFALSKDMAVMMLFAIFMLVAAISMIRNNNQGETSGYPIKKPNMNYPLILSLGFVVGIFTGMVGAGGGFMILPVLVLFGGLPMKVAIGTDLLIISAKSLIGFIGEAQVSNDIDYAFIGLITLLPLVGIIFGTWLNKKVPADKLKTAFGWFVLVMGIYIVTRELFFA